MTINKNIAFMTTTTLAGNNNILNTMNKSTKIQKKNGNFVTDFSNEKNQFHFFSLFCRYLFNFFSTILAQKNITKKTNTAKNILRKVFSNITIFQKLLILPNIDEKLIYLA